MKARPARRFSPWSDTLEVRLALTTMGPAPYAVAPAPDPTTDYDAYEAEMSAAADKTFDPNKVPPGVDPAHYKDLSYDPAIKAYRYDEADTALLVEKNLGVSLHRYMPSGPSDKGDFADGAGKKYDGCSPAPTAYFDNQWASYQKSLTTTHLGNANIDKVIVDTTKLNLTPAQLAKLDGYISTLSAADQARIVRLK